MEQIWAQRFRELREERHLSQRDVASILKIRYNVYQRYEYGERLLPITHLATLAGYYGVSSDYLLGLTQKREPPSKE